MIKGRLYAIVLTDDCTFDFYQETQCAGAIDVSIHNRGQTTLVIDDATQEEILPDESFLVDNNVAIVNRDFRLKFKKEDGKINKVILRYIVPIEE